MCSSCEARLLVIACLDKSPVSEHEQNIGGFGPGQAFQGAQCMGLHHHRSSEYKSAADASLTGRHEGEGESQGQGEVHCDEEGIVGFWVFV